MIRACFLALLAAVLFVGNAFSAFNDSISEYDVFKGYIPKTVKTKIAVGSSTTLNSTMSVTVLDSTWKPEGAEGTPDKGKIEKGLYALCIPAFDSASGDSIIGYLPKVSAYSADGTLLKTYTGDTISNAGAQVILPINTGALIGVSYKVTIQGITGNCGPHTFKGPYIYKLVPIYPKESR